MSVSRAVQLLSEIESYKRFNALEFYEPYGFQVAFHNAIGHKTHGPALHKFLMAANKVGKSVGGAHETAMHLTGLYPDWYKGIRYKKPVTWLTGGYTHELTRDSNQAMLFGEPANDDELGTGTVPRDLIIKTTAKPGVPNAYESVLVKHKSGGVSKLMFRAYEQGPKKHMAIKVDGGWLDEEPPADIWAQYLRATIATDGLLLITATPESGVTELVHQFMSDPAKGQALVRATWDDAPHLTEERKEELLGQFSAHEREMRSKGIPIMGTGLIFPVSDDELRCDPFKIPDYWVRIIGMDFGWDHPTAFAWLALDRDSMTYYLYDEWREKNARIPIAASAVKSRPDSWAPVVWPHDGMVKDKQSGRPLAELYRSQGLNMLPDPFSNPPSVGQKEGQGGQGVEVGLNAMLMAMEEGRFKVFSTCSKWFDEKGMYHRAGNPPQVIKVRDDLMSAARYAFQSVRFADIKPRPVRRRATARGLRNW